MKKILLFVFVSLSINMNTMATEKTAELVADDNSSNLLAVNSQSAEKYICAVTGYFNPTIGKKDSKGEGRELAVIGRDGVYYVNLHRNDITLWKIRPNPEYRQGNNWWCYFPYCASYGRNGIYYFHLPFSL